MGLDLSLYPLDHLNASQSVSDKRTTFGYSHTVLPLPRNSELFEDILALALEELPTAHDVYGLVAGTVPDGSAKDERYYGRFTTDNYGSPMTWVRAGALVEPLRRHLPRHPATAFVGAMDPDGLVVLGWR